MKNKKMLGVLVLFVVILMVAYKFNFFIEKTYGEYTIQSLEIAKIKNLGALTTAENGDQVIATIYTGDNNKYEIAFYFKDASEDTYTLINGVLLNTRNSRILDINRIDDLFPEMSDDDVFELFTKIILTLEEADLASKYSTSKIGTLYFVTSDYIVDGVCDTAVYMKTEHWCGLNRTNFVPRKW